MSTDREAALREALERIELFGDTGAGRYAKKVLRDYRAALAQSPAVVQAEPVGKVYAGAHKTPIVDWAPKAERLRAGDKLYATPGNEAARQALTDEQIDAVTDRFFAAAANRANTRRYARAILAAQPAVDAPRETR